MRKLSIARRVFIIVNGMLCSLAAILCILPIINILAISFSSKLAVESGNVYFFPIGFNLDNYKLIVQDSRFFGSYGVSLVRVALGWCYQLTITVLAAYPLSMNTSKFPARKIYVNLFIFVMLFNGGLIPTYLVVNATGLIDTMLALLIPCAINTFYIILIMNFMRGLPDAVLEAANIDGASHFKTLCFVVLPMAIPSIATISLFIILQHWNAWFDGMIYIRSSALKPLQTYLRSILLVNDVVTSSIEDQLGQFSTNGANGAKIFLSLIPIFVLYPFIQRYFIVGIVAGSVKE